MNFLPELFSERLKKIIPADCLDAVTRSFERERAISVRINALKIDQDKAQQILRERRISFSTIEWYPWALIVHDYTSRSLFEMDLVQGGSIYPQSLSSMLPVIVLDPHPMEMVLDLCAAPGSKTTQIAAHMRNEGTIVAVEHIRARFYKLKSVIGILGAENVQLKMSDGRKYRPSGMMFDKILVDAPCSSEGRFRLPDKKSFAYWSPRKIKEMAHKQKGLLLHASRLLKPGGTLVYSTCTFAPEENEAVIDWLLRKTEHKMIVEPVDINNVEFYPALAAWEERVFDPQIKNCQRVLPTESQEGFLMAKLVKGI